MKLPLPRLPWKGSEEMLNSMLKRLVLVAAAADLNPETIVPSLCGF